MTAVPPLFDWRVVAKLDPARGVSVRQVEALARADVDAVWIGGSEGVTAPDVWRAFEMVRNLAVPKVLEVTEPDLTVPGFDLYFVPSVLNGSSGEYLVGRQLNALARYGAIVPWQQTWIEPYIVGNPSSSAARRVGVDRSPTRDEMAAFGYLARLWRFPFVYADWSGQLAEPELVAALAEAAAPIPVVYGGGLRSADTACAMARVVRTIVVGTLVEQEAEALAPLVEGVRRLDTPD